MNDKSEITEAPNEFPDPCIPGVTEEPTLTYAVLRDINVGEHIEHKGKFSYLSWAWAVDVLLQHYPDATWEVREWDGFPALHQGESGWWVHVSVTVNGITRSQWHPVLNHQNKPIHTPSVFEFNTSIQRCLVKAIALHGLGLYIYAGEDLPPADVEAQKRKVEEEKAKREEMAVQYVAQTLEHLENNDALGMRQLWAEMDQEEQHIVWREFNTKQKSQIRALQQEGAKQKAEEA